MWRFKEFRRSVLNLWRFRKVVWNFRPYEYEFSLNVFQKCLNEQFKHIIKYGLESEHKDAISLMTASYIIEMIKDAEMVDKEVNIEILGKVISNEMKDWWI